jgi:hypothetical protein
VVVKDVAPYSIVGGNPAKHIKFRFEEDIVAVLLESQWWNLSPKELIKLQLNTVDALKKDLVKIALSSKDKYKKYTIVSELIG